MRKIIYLLVLVSFVACKFDKEKTTTTIEEPTVEILDKNLKALDQGLENFWEVEAPNGAKIVVNMDKIFVMQENPSNADTDVRYFLHITLKTGEVINMDFNYKDYVLESKANSDDYKNAAIAFRELPLEPIFSILIGQFDENGRKWQLVLHEQNFY